jgi:osmotically-inducible protein OsmY
MKVNYLKALLAVTTAILLTSAPAFASGTDQSIEASAKNSYVFKTYLKDDTIKARSMDGVVTLTGAVSEESHKSLAQETVANLPGVKRVDNQLELKGDRPAENSDGWIGMKAKSSLLFNRNVSGLDTQVLVTDGIVTLRGEAENQAQKDLAGEYAKDIQGVKEVKNEITIASLSGERQKQEMGEKIDDASITAQVKMLLLYRRSTSGFKTGVETNDGVVTLSGNADNARGKAITTKVAQDVNGVTKVINNMTIVDSLSKN